MFVVRRLQKTAQKKNTPLYLCYIDHTKKYDCVDRSFVSDVLDRSGVTAKVLAIIREFHADMNTCVRTNDGDCSDSFDVRRGLMQGCVLAKLLLNMVFSAALRVA